MIQTSIFVPDVAKVNLLIMRVNKPCTIEDAYIVVENAREFTNCKIQVIKNKTQVYGKLFVFKSASIVDIIETLDKPDELQPECLKFDSSHIRLCCIRNTKMVDAFIISCKKRVLEVQPLRLIK
jgi:hypothetical protein